MAFEPFDEFFRRMRRMFRDFDREFAEIDLRELERRPGISGFKIEIRDHGTGKPEIKVTRLGKPPTGKVPIIEEIPLHLNEGNLGPRSNRPRPSPSNR